MTKYTHELRMQVINERLSGKSLGQLAQKFNVEKTTVRKWIALYNSDGTTQLLSVNGSYSVEFKKKVLEYRWEHSLSFRQTAAHFKIPDSGTVFRWKKKYLAEGLSGLASRKKGRPSKMTPKASKKPRDLTREQELEAEIAQLKMENAFLKKLNALVQARKKLQKKS